MKVSDKYLLCLFPGSWAAAAEHPHAGRPEDSLSPKGKLWPNEDAMKAAVLHIGENWVSNYL